MLLVRSPPAPQINFVRRALVMAFWREMSAALEEWRLSDEDEALQWKYEVPYQLHTDTLPGGTSAILCSRAINQVAAHRGSDGDAAP